MEKQELLKIKEKLPPQYGKQIAELLKNHKINNRTVIRVIHGEITDPDIVVKVVDAALQIIKTRQRLKKRTNKILTNI
jgi:hypothetical protein